jgi:hypothetical protein
MRDFAGIDGFLFSMIELRDDCGVFLKILDAQGRVWLVRSFRVVWLDLESLFLTPDLLL